MKVTDMSKTTLHDPDAVARAQQQIDDTPTVQRRLCGICGNVHDAGTRCLPVMATPVPPLKSIWLPFGWALVKR